MKAEVVGNVTLGSAQTRGFIALALGGLQTTGIIFPTEKERFRMESPPVDQPALESVLTGALSSRLVTKGYHNRGDDFNHQATSQTFW